MISELGLIKIKIVELQRDVVNLNSTVKKIEEYFQKKFDALALDYIEGIEALNLIIKDLTNRQVRSPSVELQTLRKLQKKWNELSMLIR